MTLDAISFGEGVFPPWPEKFRDVSPTGWVGQIWRERQAALKFAQMRHEQNEMVRIAKVTGKQPVLAPKGAHNGNYKHGLYTAEAIASRRWLRHQTREVRALTKRLRQL